MDQCRDFYGSEEYENVARDIMNKQRGVGGRGGKATFKPEQKMLREKRLFSKQCQFLVFLLPPLPPNLKDRLFSGCPNSDCFFR